MESYETQQEVVSNTVLVEADIMRGDYYYATFRHRCKLRKFGDVEMYDSLEFLEALYKRFPSVRDYKRFKIITKVL